MTDREEKVEQTVYSVGEFLDILNRALGVKTVSVKGEITRIQKRGRNYYFSIKDAEEEAVLNCFARQHVLPSGVTLEAGHEIIVVGSPSIYKPSGSFNLTVREVLLSGEGLLLKAFEELTKKLEKEGLFASEHKKELPRFVRNVGLITASGSQAQKDFCDEKNLGAFGFRISHIDVRVQGAQSVSQIIEAIEWFNKFREDIEAIVLIRGGGSIEDLQSFNSEEVARAIFASRIPVICGVGHEGDVSIADMVADVRVSTPTGAARLLSEGWRAVPDDLRHLYSSFTSRIGREQREAHARVERIGERITHAYTRASEAYMQHLRILYGTLHSRITVQFTAFRRIEVQFENNRSFITRTIRGVREEISSEAQTLSVQMRSLAKRLRRRLSEYEKYFGALDPELKLKQGYSIAFGADGSVIQSIRDVAKGDILRTRVSDGEIDSEVEGIKKTD